MKARPFDLRDVRLLEGPFSALAERNQRYLLEVDADRLLHNFRINAKLPSSAAPLEGWENPTCELRGHFVGHFLSACSLMYASTGVERLKAKANTLVAELARCQASLGSGYLSAFPEEYIDRVETGQRVWAPWYTLHKLFAGMIDAYRHCGNTQALEVVMAMAGWAKRRIDRLSDERMQAMLKVEFGGMPEALWDLHAITGEAAHADLARRFEQRAVLGPLEEHRDRLMGLHANTQIPKALAAARAYELTGERRYHTIATYFWSQVVGRRCYCCGGTSNYEYWRDQPLYLSRQLSVQTHENCCTHNLLKLTRRLFTWDPEPRYADYYERALLNGIFGTQDPLDGGQIMYYVPMLSGSFRMFGKTDESNVCCNGTGIESFAKLADSVYFHDDAGVWVNLFLASEVHWAAKGVRLRQATRFPEEDGTAITIAADRPVAMALRVRIPAWAGPGVAVRVNGEPMGAPALPATYYGIERTWRDGDRVDVRLPMRLRLNRMPDDVDLAAVLYGPVVLAGELGAEGMSDEMRRGFGDEAYRMNTDGAVMPAPAMVATDKGNDLESWIKPVDGAALTFRTHGAGRPADVTLRPFYSLFAQRYAIYWRLYTPAQWERMQGSLRPLPDGVLDDVRVGNDDSELRHNVQAYVCERGEYAGRAWVRSRLWVRFDMDVRPDTPVRLQVTYAGDEAQTDFDILIDGMKLETSALRPDGSAGLFDMTYNVPEAFTRGKRRVAVMFKSKANPLPGTGGATGAEQTTARVFGCRTIRDVQ